MEIETDSNRGYAWESCSSMRAALHGSSLLLCSWTFASAAAAVTADSVERPAGESVGL